MESNVGNEHPASKRPATLIERIAKTFLLASICLIATIGFFAYRKESQRTLTGHVSGGEVTYMYPQSGQRVVTAVRFMPLSVDRNPWLTGGEIVFCDNVQDRFQGRHWVNVSYRDNKDGCAELTSVNDAEQQERSARDRSLCAALYQGEPNLHLPGCDEQAPAAAWAAANEKFLAGAAVLPAQHSSAKLHWPIPDTPCELVSPAEVVIDGADVQVTQKTSRVFTAEPAKSNFQIDNELFRKGTLYLELPDPPLNAAAAEMTAPLNNGIHKAGIRTAFTADLKEWTRVQMQDREVLYHGSDKAICMVHAQDILSVDDYRALAPKKAAFSLLARSDASGLESYAQHGDVKAQQALGWLYIKGKCFDRDYRAAEHWFAEAAKSGDPIADAMLGYVQTGGCSEFPY